MRADVVTVPIGAGGAAVSDRTVLFVCVENSCRSIMAEAMFNRRAPRGWRALSAGTAPATSVNPRTAPMLREIGLALPPHPPQALTQDAMERAAVRITMGCLDHQSCPARLSSLGVADWGLEDPSKLDDEGFRRVRDSLLRRVDALIRDLIEAAPPGRASSTPESAAP